jgi:hypothetical protein
MEKSVDWSRKKKELQVIKRLHFDFGKIIYWEFLDARFPIGAPEHHIHPRMLMDVCSRKLMTDAQVMTDSDTAEGNEKKLIFEYANGGCYLANDRTNPHKRGINAIIGYVMDGSASDDSPDWQELEF